MPEREERAKLISPSRLGRFYFHECERYLRYSSVRREHREAEGVPNPPYDPRPVTKAILDSGLRWEEEVLEDFLADRVHVAEADPGSGDNGPVSERVFGQDEARGVIAGLKPGEFIYQGELGVPPTFYRRYDLDPETVHWPPCRPDLVECVGTEAGLSLRVIDIKASPGVKLSHRIQATVYSLIIEALLEEWGLADRRVAGEAGVWLAQHSEPEYFDLRMLRPPIEQFLDYKTPSGELTRKVAEALALPPDYFPEYRQAVVLGRIRADSRIREWLYAELK